MFENLQIDFLHLILAFLAVGLSTIDFVFRVKVRKKQNKNDIISYTNLKLGLSREAVTSEIISIYSSAKRGEVIWGQCVSCNDQSKQIRDEILAAVTRGCLFKFILNNSILTENPIKPLLLSLKGIELKEINDSKIRIIGRSKRAVLIIFKSKSSLISVKITEPNFIKVLKDYFDNLWDQLEPLGKIYTDKPIFKRKKRKSPSNIKIDVNQSSFVPVITK